MAHSHYQDATRIEVASSVHLNSEIQTSQNGLQISTKATGTNSFIAATVAVPIIETSAVETTELKLPVSGSVSVEAGADTEELRLMKHFHPHPQKHFGVHKTPGGASGSVHVDGVSGSPSKPTLGHASVGADPPHGGNFGYKLATGGSGASTSGASSASVGFHVPSPHDVSEQEEARLMKHLKLDKGSNPGRPGAVNASFGGQAKVGLPANSSTGVGGQVGINTKVGANYGGGTVAASVNASTSNSNTPSWKLKQLEKEQEEQKKREQERVAKLTKISTPSLNVPPVTANVTLNASASVNGGVDVHADSNFGNVKISDPAQEELMLKKEEERLLKLMSGGGAKSFKF